MPVPLPGGGAVGGGAAAEGGAAAGGAGAAGAAGVRRLLGVWLSRCLHRDLIWYRQQAALGSKFIVCRIHSTVPT